MTYHRTVYTDDGLVERIIILERQIDIKTNKDGSKYYKIDNGIWKDFSKINESELKLMSAIT